MNLLVGIVNIVNTVIIFNFVNIVHIVPIANIVNLVHIIGIVVISIDFDIITNRQQCNQSTISVIYPKHKRLTYIGKLDLPLVINRGHSKVAGKWVRA